MPGVKSPLRDIYHPSRDPETGKLSFKGNPVKHHKGEPFLVDCNVTGSDVGTPADPKFALKYLWEYTPIPTIEALVAPGGPCEGATVIFQEDNAGYSYTYTHTPTPLYLHRTIHECPRAVRIPDDVETVFGTTTALQ